MKREPGEPYYRIDAAEAEQMLDKDQVVLVDVRGKEDYGKGHIPGARSIELEQVYSRIKELSGAPALVFVCYRGVTSALACEVAAAAGHQKVYNLEGGMESWASRRLPTKPGLTP
ncbi:MAG: rhodanese-like domain-containing protein [Chloroflexi bacterium]|nr:rhodanese-like domain-containing protein [Chloroflexota bacterium]